MATLESLKKELIEIKECLDSGKIKYFHEPDDNEDCEFEEVQYYIIILNNGTYMYFGDGSDTLPVENFNDIVYIGKMYDRLCVVKNLYEDSDGVKLFWERVSEVSNIVENALNVKYNANTKIETNMND